MLNNQRNDVHKNSTPEGGQYFRAICHSFNLNAKFILIEQISNTVLNKELIKKKKKREAKIFGYIN